MFEQILFIAAMLAAGVICSFLNYKLHVSKKVWGLLKINLFMQIVFFVFVVIVLSILAIIICSAAHVPESMDKPFLGFVIGLALALLPFERERKKNSFEIKGW